MLGRVTMFVAGGWLFMSAFAWPQSDAEAVNTAVGGLLCVGYALLALFIGPARYLNTVHACALCVTSLALDGGEVSAACANNVMIAAVVFGASLLSERSAARSWSRTPPAPDGPRGPSGAGIRAPREWSPPYPPC